MPIQYSLRDNRLTPDPDDRYALVEPTRSVGLDEVADRIAGSGTTVTRVDVVSVLESLQGAIAELLREGANVNLPFTNYSVSIQGVFDSDDAPFDPARHTVLPRVQPGAALRGAFRDRVRVQRQATARVAPAVLHVTDLNTGERDATLTPGGMAEVTGSRLAFDAAAADQGIVLVAEADGAETPVEVVGQNRPSRLLFLVPDVGPGGYRVEVRAGFGTEVRAGRSGAVLTVA